MTIRLLLTFLLLVMCQHNVNCFIGVKKLTTSPDADQTPRTINFLTKEIQIPDGVSDAIVSEIQKILNSYENPMLTYGQQLVDCVELKSPFEVCSSISNQFEETKQKFDTVWRNLKKQLVDGDHLTDDHTNADYFGIYKIFLRANDIGNEYFIPISIKFWAMKPGNSPSVDTSTPSPSDSAKPKPRPKPKPNKKIRINSKFE